MRAREPKPSRKAASAARASNASSVLEVVLLDAIGSYDKKRHATHCSVRIDQCEDALASTDDGREKRRIVDARRGRFRMESLAYLTALFFSGGEAPFGNTITRFPSNATAIW